jgi:hypothetical protein
MVRARLLIDPVHVRVFGAVAMRPASPCGDAPKRVAAAVVVGAAPVTGHVAKVAALSSAPFTFETKTATTLWKIDETV